METQHTASLVQIVQLEQGAVRITLSPFASSSTYLSQDEASKQTPVGVQMVHARRKKRFADITQRQANDGDVEEPLNSPAVETWKRKRSAVSVDFQKQGFGTVGDVAVNSSEDASEDEQTANVLLLSTSNGSEGERLRETEASGAGEHVTLSASDNIAASKRDLKYSSEDQAKEKHGEKMTVSHTGTITDSASPGVGRSGAKWTELNAGGLSDEDVLVFSSHADCNMAAATPQSARNEDMAASLSASQVGSRASRREDLVSRPPFVTTLSTGVTRILVRQPEARVSQPHDKTREATNQDIRHTEQNTGVHLIRRNVSNVMTGMDTKTNTPVLSREKSDKSLQYFPGADEEDSLMFSTSTDLNSKFTAPWRTSRQDLDFVDDNFALCGVREFTLDVSRYDPQGLSRVGDERQGREDISVDPGNTADTPHDGKNELNSLTREGLTGNNVAIGSFSAFGKGDNKSKKRPNKTAGSEPDKGKTSNSVSARTGMPQTEPKKDQGLVAVNGKSDAQTSGAQTSSGTPASNVLAIFPHGYDDWKPAELDKRYNRHASGDRHLTHTTKTPNLASGEDTATPATGESSFADHTLGRSAWRNITNNHDPHLFPTFGSLQPFLTIEVLDRPPRNCAEGGLGLKGLRTNLCTRQRRLLTSSSSSEEDFRRKITSVFTRPPVKSLSSVSRSRGTGRSSRAKNDSRETWRRSRHGLSIKKTDRKKTSEHKVHCPTSASEPTSDGGLAVPENVGTDVDSNLPLSSTNGQLNEYSSEEDSGADVSNKKEARDTKLTVPVTVHTPPSSKWSRPRQLSPTVAISPEQADGKVPHNRGSIVRPWTSLSSPGIYSHESLELSPMSNTGTRKGLYSGPHRQTEAETSLCEPRHGSQCTEGNQSHQHQPDLLLAQGDPFGQDALSVDQPHLNQDHHDQASLNDQRQQEKSANGHAQSRTEGNEHLSLSPFQSPAVKPSLCLQPAVETPSTSSELPTTDSYASSSRTPSNGTYETKSSSSSFTSMHNACSVSGEKEAQTAQPAARVMDVTPADRTGEDRLLYGRRQNEADAGGGEMTHEEKASSRDRSDHRQTEQGQNVSIVGGQAESDLNSIKIQPHSELIQSVPAENSSITQADRSVGKSPDRQTPKKRPEALKLKPLLLLPRVSSGSSFSDQPGDSDNERRSVLSRSSSAGFFTSESELGPLVTFPRAWGKMFWPPVETNYPDLDPFRCDLDPMQSEVSHTRDDAELTAMELRRRYSADEYVPSSPFARQLQRHASNLSDGARPRFLQHHRVRQLSMDIGEEWESVNSPRSPPPVSPTSLTDTNDAVFFPASTSAGPGTSLTAEYKGRLLSRQNTAKRRSHQTSAKLRLLYPKPWEDPIRTMGEEEIRRILSTLTTVEIRRLYIQRSPLIDILEKMHRDELEKAHQQKALSLDGRVMPSAPYHDDRQLREDAESGEIQQQNLSGSVSRVPYENDRQLIEDSNFREIQRQNLASDRFSADAYRRQQKNEQKGDEIIISEQHDEQEAKDKNTTPATFKVYHQKFVGSRPVVTVQPMQHGTAIGSLRPNQQRRLEDERSDMNRAVVTGDTNQVSSRPDLKHLLAHDLDLSGKRCLFPNPYNRINRRFHGTLQCPCCFFLCFLCCAPAVHFLGRSDHEFDFGSLRKARLYGRTTTVLFSVGGAIAMCLLVAAVVATIIYLQEVLADPKRGW